MSAIIDSLIFNRASGGVYGYRDLNRVGSALNYIRDRLIACGCFFIWTAKTDWAPQDEPTRSQMSNYLSFVSDIRRALSLLASTPAVPGDMDSLKASEANDIEKILKDVDELITKMSNAFWHSRAAVSGMGGLRR